ncbi:MAG: endonuclease/exonuclease/phosphatase family protein [Paracoccaceae bacterium]
MTHRLKLATWNICWFTNLFDDDDQLIDDLARSSMHDVSRRRQSAAIIEVLRAVDADAFVIIEAPDTGRKRSAIRALEGFAAAASLRQCKALTGLESETEQEIALLYDPDVVSARHDPMGGELDPADAIQGLRDKEAPRFDQDYPLDLDGDGDIDLHRFSKPPLETALKWLGAGLDLRLIGVHAKSKAPHGARDKEDAARISLLNRRKQLAQCAWLRERVEGHLDRDEHLVVLGDFNDGPGQDKYERVFGRSGVEVVMGDPGETARLLRNPYTRRRMTPYGARPSTARFYNRDSRNFLNALIDFVMLSPDFAARTAPEWRIWHPFDDEECFMNIALRDALLDASDHFPVSVDLTTG